MADCDNCKVDNRQVGANYTLGDGLSLCVDCWIELKDDCEPVEE